MTAFLIYVLKSALVLALLVSLFMIFMSRETFHRVNRYIMLSIVFLALLLPVVNLGIESPFNGLGDAIKEYLAAEEPEAVMDIDIEMSAFDGLPILPDVALELPSLEPVEEKSFNWLLFVAVVYLTGVVLLVVRQVLMYVQVARIIVRSKVADASMYGCKGIKLRVHDGKEKPFSWFRWVVVSGNDLGEGAREILIHETAHAHAGHSWDIVLADAVIIMQWFNPLAWIMKNSLKDIHEFEADEAVIASGVNAKQYQLLIIKKAVGARLYSIANSFNHSLTKKRITMMCKEKSKKWSCAKALYILPVAAFVACSLSTSRNAASVGKGNEFISNDASSSTGINVGITSLPPGEEWQYAHVYYTDESSGSKESVCIAYKRGAEGDNVGYFRGTTDEFDNAREGYEPGYFVVPLKNVRLEKDVMTFSIYADDATILQNPVKCAECGIVDAVNNGELWKNNASYLKGKKADFKLHLGPKFVLQNLTNPYVGGERVMGAVEIDYIYECTQEEPSGDDTDIIYQVIEEQPEFPGGMKELMKWFSENINYPEEAAKAGVQGRAFVRFVVHKDGSISSPEILRSSGNELLDTEAQRVVSSMPKWKPGMQGGKAVNVWFTLPVIFRLQGKPADGEITNLEVTVTREDGSVASSVVYDMVEVQPEFPGGMGELYKYMAKNVKYPKEARDINAQGRVIVDFVVMADGSISNINSIVRNMTSNHLTDAGKADEGSAKGIELSEVALVMYASGDAPDPEAGEDLHVTAMNALKAEAERVVRSMPKWMPGKQDGKAVNVRYSLPVVFRLQGSQADKSYKFTEQENRYVKGVGEVFADCEQRPEFPGGETELMKYLRTNIVYPKDAIEIDGQAKVYVDFVVKADGGISDVKVVNYEFSSKYQKASEIFRTEAYINYSEAAYENSIIELKDMERDIAEWERQSEILQKDGVAEVILERRRDELDKARKAYESCKKRLEIIKNELQSMKQHLTTLKDELNGGTLDAIRNSDVESYNVEKLMELHKSALNAMCDESMRVVKAMPKWKPGMQDGKAVNVSFVLPVMFRLQ